MGYNNHRQGVTKKLDFDEGVRGDVGIEFPREGPYGRDYRIVDRDNRGYQQLRVYGGECGRDRDEYTKRDNFCLRVDLPSFDGSLNIEGFIDWVAEVNRFFEYIERPDGRRVKMVAYKLTGGASVWWERIQNDRRNEWKAKVSTWEKMQKLLKRRFLPSDWEQHLFHLYQKCAQGQRSEHDYTTKFTCLDERNNLKESMAQRVSRYMSGLHPSIQEKMSVQMVLNLTDVVNLALKAESMRQDDKWQPKKKQWSNIDMEKDTWRQGGETSRGEKRTNEKVAAKKSAEPEATKQANPYVRPIPGKCFKCNQPGHRSSDCPRRKQVAIVEREEDSCSEEGGEICCDLDESNEERQVCVVRKIMLAHKPEEESQRHRLFRTRCTINGKRCDVVIDGGSQENFISMSLLEQLHLIPKKHPQPYNIAWIREVGGIKILERCRVPFSIGKYSDEIYCDIIDGLDVCGLLLGRPWLYDVHAQHEGRKNLYKLVKDEVRFTLTPIKGQQKEVTRTMGKTLVTITESSRELENDMRDSQEVYVLVVKQVIEKPEEDTLAPDKVKQLLNEFKEIMPEELPGGLPPMRDIQHQIDLIPGASWPNLPHYRMSPKENEILRAQVEELLKKGYVQESMSPCAVPALLTQKKNETWRICVDSRAINKITIGYKFPIPRLDDMLDQLSGSIVFSTTPCMPGGAHFCKSFHTSSFTSQVR